jgi:hypothetical protein
VELACRDKLSRETKLSRNLEASKPVKSPLMVDLPLLAVSSAMNHHLQVPIALTGAISIDRQVDRQVSIPTHHSSKGFRDTPCRGIKTLLAYVT